MSFIIKEVQTKSELKQFIYLPEKMHAKHKEWVPPLYSDEKRIFNKTKNLYNRYCDSIYLLAIENGKPIGRITGIINNKYNKNMGLKVARFGFLEAPDRLEVTAALLKTVEDWAKQKGMNKVVGPMGWTEEDPEGFQIDGFDQPPNLSVYQNFPYILNHMEQLGYTKEIDYMVYKVLLKNALTDLYEKINARLSRNKEISLVKFTSRKQIATYIKPVFQLMNATFLQLYGYSPLDEEEMNQLATRYLPVINPKYLQVAINSKNEVVGFVLGIPNISAGIKKAHGRLTPWGIYHILRSQATSKKLDVYLGGVREDYRSKGVDVLMGYRQMKTALDNGFEILDSHHEMETNLPMRAEMERVGGVIYKKYRIFQKALEQ